MANNTVRPHQGTGYCDGRKQDGTPQVLSYVSSDFKTWEFLGEQWTWHGWTWPIPTASANDGRLVVGKPQMAHVPRVECPYQHTDQLTSQTILKLSMAGTGKDFVFVGSLQQGNGSSFVPDVATSPTGMLFDWGGLYASAFLADTRNARSLAYGWIFAAYNLGAAVGGATFDCALSLPRVMSTRTLASGAVVPTWEIAPDVVAGLRLRSEPTVMTKLTVPPSTALPIALPAEAVGDALELRLNVSSVETAKGRVGLSVRATNGTKPAEQTLIVFTSSTYDGEQQGGEERQEEASTPLRTGLHVIPTSADVHATAVNLVAAYPDDEAPQKYSLRVFVDKSVIEAHVNARLSVTSRAYPLRAEEATHAFVVNQSPSHAIVVDSVEVWGLGSIWK